MDRPKITRDVRVFNPEKLEISVTLEKYALFKSNSEVTFTIEGKNHKDIIEQLIDAVSYFSDQFKDLVQLE